VRDFSLHRAGDAGKGDILFLEREFFLFRTGANVNAAQVPRDATPIFFPEKENGRRPSKRKAFPIASEQLEELQCLPIALPCARRSRVEHCYTICPCSYYPLPLCLSRSSAA